MAAGKGYTLTEAIHESASTTIYRGYRNADRVSVAIKRLKSDRPSPTEVARIKYEWAIVKDLAAPGVVRAFGIEKVGDNLALIMEDAGGRALYEIIRSQKLSSKDVVQIALSVASTLESVHRSGVIHMDVKPHNIIVDMTRLEGKLTDFGSATRLSQETQRPKSPAGAQHRSSGRAVEPRRGGHHRHHGREAGRQRRREHADTDRERSPAARGTSGDHRNPPRGGADDHRPTHRLRHNRDEGYASERHCIRLGPDRSPGGFMGGDAR